MKGGQGAGDGASCGWGACHGVCGNGSRAREEWRPSPDRSMRLQLINRTQRRAERRWSQSGVLTASGTLLPSLCVACGARARRFGHFSRRRGDDCRQVGGGGEGHVFPPCKRLRVAAKSLLQLVEGAVELLVRMARARAGRGRAVGVNGARAGGWVGGGGFARRSGVAWHPKGA